MTVEVHYTRKGEDKVESFDSEQAAGVFMDGLYAQDDHAFNSVRYPDREPDTTPRPSGRRPPSVPGGRDG